MRLPRLTTRRLMALVAAAAFAFGGCRAFDLAMAAKFHRGWARAHRTRSAVCRQRAADPRASAQDAASYRDMAEAFERAARWNDYWAAHPWLLPRQGAK